MTDPVLESRGLTRYFGAKAAVYDVSLALAPGEVLVRVLLPAAAAKAAWSVVTDQGADVTVYMGTINRATGAVIGVEWTRTSTSRGPGLGTGLLLTKTRLTPS